MHSALAVSKYLGALRVCRFSGEECNRTVDFTQFFDSYYYNCFTYRAPPGHVDGEDSNLAEGLENGWSAVVLTGSSMLDQNADEIRMIPGKHTPPEHDNSLTAFDAVIFSKSSVNSYSKAVG